MRTKQEKWLHDKAVELLLEISESAFIIADDNTRRHVAEWARAWKTEQERKEEFACRR